MHGDLQKSAKDSTLEHCLFAALKLPRSFEGRLEGWFQLVGQG